MQVVRNIGYVKQQQRRGRILTALGFIALAFAFVLVWQKQFVTLIIASYGAMLIGFVVYFGYSMRHSRVGKEGGEPREDDRTRGPERVPAGTSGA